MTVALQTVDEELKVHGINPNGNTKYKTAGGLNLGGTTWVNVAQGVDMKTFKFNHINKVKRLMKEDGTKGNVVELISVGEPFQNTSSGKSSSKGFVDNSKGQREGAIGHYTSRLVSAFVVLGKIETEKEAVEAFHKIYEGLNEKFGKTE